MRDGLLNASRIHSVNPLVGPLHTGHGRSYTNARPLRKASWRIIRSRYRVRQPSVRRSPYLLTIARSRITRLLPLSSSIIAYQPFVQLLPPPAKRRTSAFGPPLVWNQGPPVNRRPNLGRCSVCVRRPTPPYRTAFEYRYRIIAPGRRPISIEVPWNVHAGPYLL